MPTLQVADGTEIFYREGGPASGQPIIFAHGWPLTADMWDPQMLFFASRGFHAIAFDRRGFGRSSHNWDGNTYENSADDLAALIAHLKLDRVILVGHSMAGGEFATYATRHGTEKLAAIITAGSNLPQIIKSEANPTGFTMDNFDEMRDGLLKNRAAYFKTMPKTPYNFNKFGHKTDDGLMHSFWSQAMMAGIKPAYDFIEQFSERDFTSDLQNINVPMLIIHGDADQGTPITATAKRAAKLMPNARLCIYAGASHMIPTLNAAQFNADIVEFVGGR